MFNQINSMSVIQKIRTKAYHFLRWTEKWTKTDMIYLTKGGFWLTIGQIFSALSSFILAIAFANLLPKETYGSYKYVLSIAGILSIFTLPGMGSALVRSIARGNDGSFLLALKTRIRWGLLGGAVSLGLAVYYFINHSQLALAFLIAAIFIPFLDSIDLYRFLLQGKKKFDVLSKYTIYIKILATLAILAAVFFSQNLVIIIITYFLAYTSLRYIFHKKSLNYLENNKTDHQTVSFGKHLSLVEAISRVSFNVDKILLWHFIGPIEVALYSISIAIPEQIKGLFIHISTLSLPKLSNKSTTEIKKNLDYKLGILFFIFVTIFIIYYLLAPCFFKLFFPQYLDAIVYSQIYCAIVLMIPAAYVFGPILKSQQKTKLIYITNISKSVVYFSLLLILILLNSMNITNLITVKLISELFFLLIRYAYVKRL